MEDVLYTGSAIQAPRWVGACLLHQYGASTKVMQGIFVPAQVLQGQHRQLHWPRHTKNDGQ